MTKFFKITAWILGALILLFIAAIIVATTMIDPNSYKSKIENYVHDKTGRNFTIKGKMSLSFFPWVGLHIPEIVIGNPSGFSGPALADIQALDVKISTFPLISGDVEVKELDLSHAKISLITNKNNQTNWSSWTKPQTTTVTTPVGTATIPVTTSATPVTTPAKTEKAPMKMGPRSLSIERLKIEDSSIQLINQKTNVTQTFDKLNLSIKNFDSQKNFPLQISFVTTQSDRTSSLELTFNSIVNLNLITHVVDLNRMVMDGTLSRPKLPNLPIKLQGNLQFDPDKQTLQLTDSTLSIANMNISDSVHAKDLFKTPQFNLSLASRGIQLGPFLKTLYGKQFATGTLQFQTDLAFIGANSKQIISNLNGRGNFEVSEGTLQGIDVGHLLSQALAYINKNPQPQAPQGPAATHFKQIQASFTIKNGIIDNQDFKMLSGNFTTVGKGDIDLVQQQWLNYTLNTSFQNKDQKSDFTLPIVISGPLTKPSIVPDFASIAKNFIKNQIQQYFDKNAKTISNKIKAFFN